MSTISELDKNFKIIDVADTKGLRWLDPSTGAFAVRGLAWFEPGVQRWCRLPARAESIVRKPVWELAQHTAGARICFKTDSARLAVRVQGSGGGVMPHMPASGSHGLALFEGRGKNARPWCGVIPEAGKPEMERELFKDLPRKMREFALYLPLYSGLRVLTIGVEPETVVKPPSPAAHKKPVVFYGTSITQGGCASLPGSDHVATVGRRLNLDVINLGFSGNGQGDPEVAELIAEIDAALYVLSYCENVGSQQLRQTLPAFIDILRRRHSRAPILLVGALPFWQNAYAPGTRREYMVKNDFMRRERARRCRAGDRALYFIHGADVMPPATDATYVDGVHPTDCGFQLMAKNLTRVIGDIIL